VGRAAAAGLLWYLVVFGSYERVEKVFILMTAVFFAYPAAALVGGPDWGAVARGAFVPTLHRDPEYIFLLVGLIGTTITPYMQLGDTGWRCVTRCLRLARKCRQIGNMLPICSSADGFELPSVTAGSCPVSVQQLVGLRGGADR
jgi:hypothetical protein